MNSKEKKITRLLGIVLICILHSFLYAANEQTVQLTKKERLWIQNNPNIILGADENWKPFDFVDENGQHCGFDAEYLALLNKKLGLNIRVKMGNWSELQTKVKNKELMGLIGPSKTEDRMQYMHFTEAYFMVSELVFMRKDSARLKSLAELKNKKLGVKRGSSELNFLQKKYPEIILKVFEDNAEILRAVSMKEVDAGISNIGAASYEIKRNFISNLEVAFEVKELTGDMRFGITKNAEILVSILNKGINAIAQEEIQTLLSKWLVFSNKKNTHMQTALQLTQEELNYIEKSPVLKVGGQIDWIPFDFIDKKGNYRGISKDIIELVATKTGLRFDYSTDKTWKELLESMRKGEIDILPAVYKSDKREKFIHFSPAYFKTKDYIFMRNGDAPIITIDELETKRIAVIDGYKIMDLLAERFPKTHFVKVNTLADGIDAVLLNKADAYIDGFAVVKSYLSRNLLVGIKPIIPVDFYENELFVGVNKEQKVLASIVNKAVQSITLEEKNRIFSRWFGLTQKDVILETDLEFTPLEKEWLIENPVIRLAFMNYWPSDDENRNIHSEYVALLQKYGNLNISLVRFDNWKDGYQRAVNGSYIHGILNLSWSKIREKEDFEYTSGYNFSPSYLIVKQSNNSIHQLKDLMNKSIYINEDSILKDALKTLNYRIDPVFLRNEEETHRALFNREGKADALLTYTYDKNKVEKYGLKVVQKIYNEYGEVHLGVSKNQKTLASIIRKVSAKIPKKEISMIQNKKYQKDKKFQTPLSVKENSYLAKTVKIRVHNEKNWGPFNFVEFGQPSGYSIDLIKLVAKKTGLPIEFVTGPTWNEFLDMSKTGEIDILLNAVNTKERLEYLNFTDPYYVAEQGLFVRKNDQSIKTFKDILQDKTIAVIRGFYYHEYFLNNYPKLELYIVETAEEAVLAVSEKKADVALGLIETLEHATSKQYITNIRYFRDLKEKIFTNVPLCIAVPKENITLFSILEKGLSSITRKERWDLYDKWLKKNDKDIRLDLTDDEYNWLENHKIIKFTGDPTWLPYESFQKDGTYIGVISDHLKIIEKRLGISLEYIAPKSWSDAVKMAENREVDIISASVFDNSSRYGMNFTKKYMSSPLVVIMKKSDENIFVADLNQIKEKKIGYIKEYGYAKNIIKEYPSLNFVAVENVQEGLEKTASGEIDAMVSSLTIGSYNISLLGLSNLEVVGRLSIMLDLGFGIRDDWEILRGLFDKAIDSISEQEQAEIINKWIQVNIEGSIDYTKVWQAVLGMSFFLFFIIFWNRKLKQMVNRKTAELEILLEKFDKNVLTSEQDENGMITNVSDALLQVTGYTKEELIGQHYFIFFPKQKSEKQLEKMNNKILSKKDIIFHKLEERKKNNTTYYVKVYISPKFDKKGKFRGWSSIREDISGQIEIEKLSSSLEQKVKERTIELHQAKEKFESMVSNVPGAIYRAVNDNAWPVIYVSDEIEKITGYLAFEFISGKIVTFSTIMHPDDIGPIGEKIQKQFAKDQAFQVDYRVISKSGDIVWVRSQGQSIQGENGISYIDGILIDITDAKVAQKELEEQKQYSDSIMNAQNNIVISTDGVDVISANKAFFEFYEVSSEDEFMEKFGNCICDTFCEDVSSEYIKKVTDGENWIDFIYNRMEQTHKVIIEKNNFKYTFSISVDKFMFKGKELITAVFSNITELEETQKNIQIILSNIMLPVLITSQETRKVLYANEYASKQYEMDVDELIGLEIDNIYTNIGQKDEIQRIIEEKGYVENLEEIYKTKTGREFIALLSVKPAIYQNEKSYIGMVVDITKQKQIEDEIRLMHKHTKDSIQYASLIQKAIMPDETIFHTYFEDFFTMWEPKDVVGGDIFLFEEFRDNEECLMMVIDCTGHGVPGAFVTMLVKAIERQVLALIKADDSLEVSPGWILGYFNQTMKKLLKQENESALSNAGFDGGILYYNKKTKNIKYSGACTPLFYFDENKQWKTIKSSRHSVGYTKSNPNFIFKEFSIDVKKGMQFYITTDGYLDQNGGKKGFPLGKRKFAAFIEDIAEQKMATQEKILQEKLLEYQGKEDRNDDVTVIGFRI